MLETSGTPWITSTSPGCARLCASNSAMRLTCRRAPSSGSMRCRMLRTVSAGPTMVLPGMVGRSTEAPMTPHGTPSSSMVSEMIPVGSPSAIRRSTTPCGGARNRHQLDVFGRDTAGQSLRLCSVHWSAPRCAALLSPHFTSTPRGEKGAVGWAKSPAENGQIRLGSASDFAHADGTRGHCAGVCGADDGDEPRAMPTYGSRRKTCVAGGLHCGWAACPGGRRSLPLPPFRQSGFRSFGIGPHSFIASTRFLRRTGRPSPGDAKAKQRPIP